MSTLSTASPTTVTSKEGRKEERKDCEDELLATSEWDRALKGQGGCGSKSESEVDFGMSGFWMGSHESSGNEDENQESLSTASTHVR